MKKENKRMSTETMVLGAVLTALVIVLQYLSMAIRFGTFSITLSLTPIVIGALTCGMSMGAWLGLVFGVTVLLTGDAAPFWAVSAGGTFITVIAKGIAAGFFPALVFKFLKKFNQTAASAVAAIISPIANTGVFLLGCVIFFIPTLIEWYGNVTAFLVTIFSFNFVIELVLNIVLTPVIIRLMNMKVKN
ncbi:MAG: ECF transporter S component [Ruminococcaceae bacterium]|nr:ECF transporter S component [Oscillospiraceae bacterium]